MSNTQRSFVLALLLLTTQLLQAQDSTQKTKPRFKLSINYNSGLNYYGRTDSLKSAGFFPLAEFWLNKDFYVNAAPVFVNNKAQSFDYAGTVTTVGYQHITARWITGVYVVKPFYKQSSALVQSALQAQAGASFSRLNKIVNLTVGGDAKFSDRVDFGATAGLDHLIRVFLKNKTVLVIDPSVYAYAGTQNFTNTYYKKQPGFILLPGSGQQVTQNVQQFHVLAYEISLPLVCVKGKWMALLTPAYILPQNLVSVAGRPDLSEKGSNMFYATTGIKYSF